MVVTWNASSTAGFFPLLPALRRLTAQLSWVGGLQQQQQLSKGGPQTYQITLTPPPRGAFKQIIRSFLGHHHAQQASTQQQQHGDATEKLLSLHYYGQKARQRVGWKRRMFWMRPASLTLVMIGRDIVLNIQANGILSKHRHIWTLPPEYATSLEHTEVNRLMVGWLPTRTTRVSPDIWALWQQLNN